jgi:hypothetical protein
MAMTAMAAREMLQQAERDRDKGPKARDVVSIFDPFDDDAASSPPPISATSNPSCDEFDPFNIGASKKKSTKNAENGESSSSTPHHNVHKIGELSSTSTPHRAGGGGASVSTKGSTALPPRMVVKFIIHEEISSVANVEHESEGASDVFVQGTISVRIK